MEALAEQVIAVYLTRGGKVFIAPQYAIPGSNVDQDWSCPDFVALDFARQEVVVVEVSSASSIRDFLLKVKDREHQWFDRLRLKLDGDGVAIGWEMRFLGFVRKQNLPQAQKEFAGQSKVTFKAIEDVTFSWDYWEDRKTDGLPQ